MKTLVFRNWLVNHLNDQDLVLLFVNHCETFDKDLSLIKGSRVFDLKREFSNSDAPFPNTFPTKVQFESGCRSLGIHKSSKIVVYDARGVYYSPRVWWMFKAMGHEDIAVLDGGLPGWAEAGLPIDKLAVKKYESGAFIAVSNPDLVKDLHFVSANLVSPVSVLIDARSADRFNSLIPEPRQGLRNGNIPNSINIPHAVVTHGAYFKPLEQLEEILCELPGKETALVFSCGSGITACIVFLACEIAGLQNHKSVYDGSWTEWGTIYNQGLNFI